MVSLIVHKYPSRNPFSPYREIPPPFFLSFFFIERTLAIPPPPLSESLPPPPSAAPAAAAVAPDLCSGERSKTVDANQSRP